MTACFHYHTVHVFTVCLCMICLTVWPVPCRISKWRVSVRFPIKIACTFLVSPSVTTCPAYHALTCFIILTVLFDLSKAQNSWVRKLILLLWVVCYVQVNTHMRKLDQIMCRTQLPMNSPVGMEITVLLYSE